MSDDKNSTERMRNKQKQASLQSSNSTKDIFVNIESSVSNCKNWNKAYTPLQADEKHSKAQFKRVLESGVVNFDRSPIIFLMAFIKSSVCCSTSFCSSVVNSSPSPFVILFSSSHIYISCFCVTLFLTRHKHTHMKQQVRNSSADDSSSDCTSAKTE